MKIDALSRREFLHYAGVAALAAPLAGLAATPAEGPGKGRRKIAVFTKTLQWTSLTQMADMVAECGFDGLDLTVRPRGHVEPERVKEDLPRFAEAMKNVGKEIVMLTTAIGSADEPHTDDILSTAAKLGIGHYRTTWYRYRAEQKIDDTLQECVTKLKGLATLNAKHRIKAGYQNHAGASVGSPVWDLALILREVQSPWIGCQYDIRHAMVEGTNAWTVGFDYIGRHINTFIFKDYAWTKGSGQWRPVNVPLGDGMVDFAAYAARIKALSLEIPVTLHMEYDLGGAELGQRNVSITPPQMIAALKSNLAVVRRALDS
ncbi:MAG: sugar phosphate isomerase/epimerase [Opitutus sp.]|nr:sugar phosphate isomerase/epimerase [Opitutus sp.]